MEMDTKYLTIPIRMYGNALELLQCATCDIALATGVPEVLWAVVYTEKFKNGLLKIADDLDALDDITSVAGS